jgi:hypothetical protein
VSQKKLCIVVVTVVVVVVVVTVVVVDRTGRAWIDDLVVGSCSNRRLGCDV